MSAFTLIAQFVARDGEHERLATELNAMIEPSLAEDGCLEYHPYVDPTNPAHMVIIEKWVDQAALDAHFQTPHFRRVAGVLDKILVEPFALSCLTENTAPEAQGGRRLITGRLEVDED